MLFSNTLIYSRIYSGTEGSGESNGTDKRKRLRSSDDRFFDVYFDKTNIYTLEPTGVQVEFPDGRVKFYKGGFFGSFVYKCQVHDMASFLKNNMCLDITPSLLLGFARKKESLPDDEHVPTQYHTPDFNQWLHVQFVEVDALF